MDGTDRDSLDARVRSLLPTPRLGNRGGPVRRLLDVMAAGAAGPDAMAGGARPGAAAREVVLPELRCPQAGHAFLAPRGRGRPQSPGSSWNVRLQVVAAA